jgi:hypothetical protein
MESGVLNSLSLIFLVAGTTLWLTSLGLARRAEHYRCGMQALLQLAGRNLEPLDIPLASWPVLEGAGWQSLQWTGDWYGQPVHGELGLPLLRVPSMLVTQTFIVTSGDEVQLTLTLLHGAPKGEQRLFANQLAQVFLLLLETRLRERTGALSVALAERARLSLYLQHDMRNMTQWVSWVSADFANANTSEALLAAARRLKANAPLAHERALRLNAALGKTPQADVPCAIDLHHALTQAAGLAGLELTVLGEATAWIAPGALARALDNLLSNLAAEWRDGYTAPPHAELATLEDPEHQPPVAQATLSCPLPVDGMGMEPERLFEPFASGRPGGLGLGLYQARKSLRDAGGGITAAIHGAQLRFILQLPQAHPSPMQSRGGEHGALKV